MHLKGTWTNRGWDTKGYYFSAPCLYPKISPQVRQYMWGLAQTHLNPKGKNFLDRTRGFRKESALLPHLGQTSYSLVYSLPCPGDHRFMPQDARQTTSRYVCIILITFTVVQCNFPKCFTYFISETVTVRILKYKPASVIHLWTRSSAIVKRERKKSCGEELFGVKKNALKNKERGVRAHLFL